MCISNLKRFFVQPKIGYLFEQSSMSKLAELDRVGADFGLVYNPFSLLKHPNLMMEILILDQ